MLLQLHEPGETPLPHEDDRDLAVGIDLGTTNSVVAISAEGRPEVVRDASGRGLVPSVVAYGAETEIGAAALARLIDAPDTVVSSIKRLMGRGAADVKALAEAGSIQAVDAVVAHARAEADACRADLSRAFAESDLKAATRDTLRLTYLTKLIDEARSRRLNVA